MSENLYEAPKSVTSNPVNMAAVGAAFQDAGILYLRKGFVSPPVCIKSGLALNPSSKKYKMNISYIAPLAYLCILFGLPGLLVLACIQKSLRMQIYLSEENARIFQKNRLIAWGSFFISILLAVAAIYFGLGALGLASGGVFVFTLIWAAMANKVLKVIRYKNNFFEVARAHPDFLAHIPLSSTPTTSINFNNSPIPPMK